MNFMLLNALLGLTLFAILLLIGALLVSLWYAGRELTPPGHRTDLGRTLGWFCFHLGCGLIVVSMLALVRWIDFHPGDPLWLTIPLRVLSIVLLALAADRARVAGPLVLHRIEQGRLI